MTMDVQKRLISLRDACVRYGISRQTIYRAIARSELRLIKIGRASRLDVLEADCCFGVIDNAAA